MASKELKEFARRADEAESVLATLQAQIDYLSTMNTPQTQAQAQSLVSQDIEIEDLILKELYEEKCIDSRDFARKYNLHKNDVYGACNALEGEQFIIKKQKSTKAKTSVSAEGLQYIQNGSPECQLINLLLQMPNKQISLDAIHKHTSNELKDGKIFNIAKNKACRNKWIKIHKKQRLIETLVQSCVSDEIQKQLIAIQSCNDMSQLQYPGKVIKELKSRKLLESKSIKYYIISRGSLYAPKRKQQIKEITLDVLNKHLNLENNEWTGPEIKPFNFNAKGHQLSYGSLHPLMKMRAEMRRILLDMGFQEMETNRYVESSFWNFDALFQPQQHPARDAHDTFFLDQPKQSDIGDKYSDYMKRVSATHSKGGYGSIGWRYNWQQSEAQKNLLRTHTTAISSRTLFKLAQQKGAFKPVKYFSIDRVFRNESIDATHLAEFHQVEGFVADYDLTLGHLLGTIGEFFKRIGIPNVRFKPAYNPYTEPSMEIFGWSNERQDWIEVGNSGVFRPEMLQPMGLPENVKVIAWGLGLERPCMIATGVKDIRELFGPRVDINMVKTFPIVRYDTCTTTSATDSNMNKKKKDQGFKEM